MQYLFSTTTYEVHTSKTKNKRKHEETFLFIIFSFESLYLQLQIFYNRNRSYDIAHDENAMSSLIIQSIQQGQVKNSYRCSQKCCNINRKIPVQETLFNKELMRLQHRCLLGNIAEFLRSPVLKNVCERLLLPDVIYSAFIYCTVNCFKMFASEQKYKNILKNCVSQKKYLQFSCNVYVKLYYKILWFYQDLKSKNLCFQICTQFNQREYWTRHQGSFQVP